MISSRRPPTFMPDRPCTQPGMTLPGLNGVVNGWLFFHEESNSLPVL